MVGEALNKFRDTVRAVQTQRQVLKAMATTSLERTVFTEGSQYIMSQSRLSSIMKTLLKTNDSEEIYSQEIDDRFKKVISYLKKNNCLYKKYVISGYMALQLEIHSNHLTAVGRSIFQERSNYYTVSSEVISRYLSKMSNIKYNKHILSFMLNKTNHITKKDFLRTEFCISYHRQTQIVWIANFIIAAIIVSLITTLAYEVLTSKLNLHVLMDEKGLKWGLMHHLDYMKIFFNKQLFVRRNITCFETSEKYPHEDNFTIWAADKINRASGFLSGTLISVFDVDPDYVKKTLLKNKDSYGSICKISNWKI
ncbi:hypothetical protein AB837_00253 [bacterium AB1]|nr:hypothetical protein AB837_00253 [bacterium AB1]